MPNNANHGPRVADLDPQSKVHLGLFAGMGACVCLAAGIMVSTTPWESSEQTPGASATPTIESQGGFPNYWESPGDNPSPDTTDTPSASPSARPHHRSPSPAPSPTKTKSPHKRVAYCPLVMGSGGAVQVCHDTTAYEFGLGTVADGHSFKVHSGQFVIKICGNKTNEQTEIRTTSDPNQLGWVTNTALPKGGKCQPA